MNNTFAITIWTTSRCNFRCTYCYEKKKHGVLDLSHETADRIIDFIKERIEDTQELIIQFHGGEPLLNYEIIKYIVSRIEKEIPNKKSFGLTTNCSLLDDDKIDFLCTHFPLMLSLSIDGDKKTHNYHRKCINGNVTYERILSNAHKILNKIKKVRIRMTYTKATAKDLFENVRFFIEQGFTEIVPVPDVFCNDWTNEDFKVIECQFKKIKQYLIEHNIHDIEFEELSDTFKPKGICGAGRNHFNVDPSGYIYPCTFVVGDDTQCIGNIYSGLNEQKIEALSCINKRKDLIVGCKDCLLSKYCITNRCLLINYAITGDYYKPDLVSCNLMNIRYNLIG